MTANAASERSRILASPTLIPPAVGLCLYGLLLLAGNRLLNDPDSYWHLVVGRWIVEHRGLPIADPFSFTMMGAHWIAKEWLSQIFYAGPFPIPRWTRTALPPPPPTPSPPPPPPPLSPPPIS